MSEAALRAEIPPHFSKDSPCWSIFHELRGINNKLKEIGAAKTHSIEDLAHYRQMLNAIDNRRGAGGVFAGALEHDVPAEAQRIPEGQAVCADELAAAYAQLESLTDSAAPMSARMLAIRDRLEAQKARLAAALERGAAADAPEVQQAQRELDEVDAQRLAAGGVFAGDVAKGVVPAGQATLSSLLNHCYGQVKAIQMRAEP